jgi:hypothetical protein
MGGFLFAAVLRRFIVPALYEMFAEVFAGRKKHA